MTIFFGVLSAWKDETQSIQLQKGNCQRSNCEQETWSFFQQFKRCSDNESCFLVHFEKYRRRMIPILLRARKQYPAGPIETGVHEGRLGKAKRNP